MQSNRPQRVYIAVHILFWMFIALLPFLAYGNPTRLTTENIIRWLQGLLFSAGLFYLFYGYVIRTYLKSRALIKFFLVSISFFFGYCALELLTDYLTHSLVDLNNSYKFITRLFSTIILNTFIAGAALLVLLIENWFLAQKYQQEIERERLESELKMLRFQVNPHFLFNTLNNIYSLVYRKSDRAPEALLKLSSLMRYMLYETEGNSVPLTKELEYLENFVELQRLRLATNQHVSLNVEGDAGGYEIAPLLLVPFIENAFKHGILASKDTVINISVSVKDGILKFTCMNNCRPDINSQVNSGIGMTNVKKRLELIYNGRYQLDIEPTDGKYKINLTLSL